MILYVFISHQKNIKNCHQRIMNMMVDDFLFVVGGNLKDEYDTNEKLLKLNCNDTYIGLSEKVIKTFHFILTNDIFKKYTHFVKMDDDMIVENRFNYNDIKELDYFGIVCDCPDDSLYDRKWHMGKTGTYWDKLEYQGDYKPFCSGGFGYGVSKKALFSILPDYDYITNIYEDVNIGLLMNKAKIKPTHIAKMRYYIKSPNHNNQFITNDNINYYQEGVHYILNKYNQLEKA